MLIEKHTYDNGLAIALWDIQESEEELMSLLNNDEVVAEEIIPFTSTKRRLEYLLCQYATAEAGRVQHSPTIFRLGYSSIIAFTHSLPGIISIYG